MISRRCQAMPSRARLALAIAMGQMAGAGSRLLGIGGGTSLSGVVARYIDPRVLRKIALGNKTTTVVVTGSNGKTTTSQMLTTLAAAAGHTLVHNRTGSNLIQGVASAAVNRSTLGGRLDCQMLIFEVDEATTRLAVPEIEPDLVVVTNIFRDQLDRYGELHAVAGSLDRTLASLPPEAAMVLNADDPMVASFATETLARRLYFGVTSTQVGTAVPEHASDTIRCVRCQHDLEYARVYLGHMGDYRCPACQWKRPHLDVAVSSIKQEAGRPSLVTVDTSQGQFIIELPLAGLHNVYNLAAAVAAAVGLGINLEQTVGSIGTMHPAFGRMEQITAGSKRIVLSFVKNPISYNTTLRTVIQMPGQKHVLASHSNTLVDGEDFAWLWDVDLEELVPQLASLVVTGTKAEEVAMRFKYAGLDEQRIEVVPDHSDALDAALARVPDEGTLFILAGYTPTRQLRRIMEHRGWVEPVWKEV